MAEWENAPANQPEQEPGWENAPSKGKEDSLGGPKAAAISAAKGIPIGGAAVAGAEVGGMLGTTFGPVGTIVGGVLGGLAGGLGASFATEQAIGAYDKDLQQKLSKIQEEHPTWSTAGSLASFAPFTGVGTKALTQLAEQLGTTATKVGAGAAVAGGAIDVGMQAMGDKPIDKTSVAMSAFATPLMLGGTKASKLLEKGVKKLLPKEVPPLSPIVETAIMNKETGSIEPMGPKHDEVRKVETKDSHTQGFLTESGEFLTRKEAAKRAKETGQLPQDHKFERPEEGLHSGDMRTAGDKRFELTPDYDVSQWQKELSNPPVKIGAFTPEEGGKGIARRDKTTGQVEVNPEEVKKSYESSGPNDRPWIKEHFPTVEKYQEFIIEHEQVHGNTLQKEGESILDYEKRVTAKALENLKTKPKPTETEQYHTQGKEILKTQGPEAAKKFAEAYHAEQNVLKEYLAARNMGGVVPKTNEDLEKALYSLGKNKEADKVEYTKDFLQPAQADGLTLEFNKEFIAHVEEGKPLSPKAQELFDKYQKPILDRIKMLTKEIQDRKWKAPTEFSEDFLGRKTVPRQVSLWEKTKSKLLEGDQGGLNLNIEARPGAAMERGLFVVEFPNGKRQVIQLEAGKVHSWVNNKKKPMTQSKEGGWASFDGGVLRTEQEEVSSKGLKSGMKLGTGIVKEATQTELEKHTPYRYNKSTLSVSIEKLQGLQDFYRSKQLVENLKKSELFSQIAHKIEPHTDIPEGFRIPKHLDKLPEFAGYAFDRKSSYIIEDFSKNYKPNILTMISGVLIKNMMLDPLPHMMNEAWHLWNARGLTGWVTPKGIERFVNSAIPAVRSVMKQDDHFRSLLRDGASLLSADVRNSPVQKALLERGMKEFVDSPEGRSMASKYGMVPLDLYNALSRKSNQAMWVMRDSMYMQLINEKMGQGMSQKAAIEAVESHMPPYKISTEVMKSRQLSEMLQNPNISVFSRYHYGMMKSLTNTAGDLVGKRGVQGFKEGVDSAAAIAVAISVLYPLQDMFAQMLTGNKDATTRRAGPYHVIHAVSDVIEGEKQPYSVMASMFTFNPALLAGAQLIADRQLYNGQPVYHPQDNASMIAKDVGKYVLTQVPQVSTALQVSGEKGGGLPQWAAKQVDIVSPTPEQTKSQQKIKTREEKASENRARKIAAKQRAGQ